MWGERSRRAVPVALALAGAAATAVLAVALARTGGLRATFGAALAQQGTWICIALAGAAAGGALRGEGAESRAASRAPETSGDPRQGSRLERRSSRSEPEASGAAGPAARLGLVRGRLGARDALVAAIGFVALSQALHELLVLFELRDRGALGAIDALAARARGAELALALASLGLAPGFAEELLFRGWIQRALVARFGAAAGVLAASLLFALVHADLVQSAAALLLGLYLGVVAERGGAIGACVLAHATNNVLTVLAAGDRMPLPEGGAAGAAILALVAAAALAHVGRVTASVDASSPHGVTGKTTATEPGLEAEGKEREEGDAPGAPAAGTSRAADERSEDARARPPGGTEGSG